MALEIKKLDTTNIDQFIALIYLFEEVFEMKNFILPPKEHLQYVLDRPGFFVFVAIQDNQIVGGLTAYTFEQYYAQKPLAYVFDLAVKAQFQRKGIGKKLMAAITSFCQQIGYEEVFVQADKVDDYALDFYRSTPITNEEEVVHFYYSLK